MGPMLHLKATLKDLNGNVLHKITDQLSCWIEHFSEHYGSKVPFDDSALHLLDLMPVLNNLNVCPDTSEVMSALKALKSGKSPDIAGI